MSVIQIRRLLLVITLFCSWGAMTTMAQVPVNTDSLFIQAQEQARLSNYHASRTLLKQVLKAAPAYTDAALLMGRTYAWESEFDSARIVLQPLHAREPSNLDVILALADVELWAGDLVKALAYANSGLETDPEAVALLLVKVRVLQQLQNYPETVATLRRVLELEPDNTQASQMLRQAEGAGQVNNIRAEYQVSTFSKNFSGWQLGMLEYTRVTPKSKYLGRVMYANRYEQQSAQFDIEAYPRLNDKVYLYLNAGVSDGDLFPEYRAGADVYHLLPYKFEASIGARLLSFSQGNVVLYTGYFGKYFKKQWVSFRPFLQNIDGDWQATGILLLRQYLKQEDDHITLVLSQGSTPLTQVGLNEIGRLGASKIGVEAQFRAGKNFLAGGLFSFEYEEYVLNSYRNRYTFGLSLQRRF